MTSSQLASFAARGSYCVAGTVKAVGIRASSGTSNTLKLENTAQPLPGDSALYSTHRPPSSSFFGLPYRILNINHKRELLRGLWVSPKP